MKKATTTAVLVGLAIAVTASAEESATPGEVITKVKEAAAYLEKEGKAGLATFDQPASPFVWKDTYVFVLDCAADKNVAHPEQDTRGVSMSTVQDKTGKHFGPLLCAAAERPNGGWVEYMWPKAVVANAGNPAATHEITYADEPSRKVTYMLAVPEQPYQVGAGIYNDSLTVEELDELSELD